MKGRRGGVFNREKKARGRGEGVHSKAHRSMNSRYRREW